MAASLLEETMRADVQAEKAAEILELKAMIVALREQMEALSFSKDAAIQKAVQRSADEIQQLKNTASSLRNELENLRFEKDAAVQVVNGLLCRTILFRKTPGIPCVSSVV